MKLNNVSQIRSEDFDAEYEQLISRLGFILNSFMQEVVELSDKRVNFDNKEENLISFEVTIDSNGLPNQTNVNVRKSSVNGCQVINAINLTNRTGYPTSQPYISFDPQGNGFIKVNNITGLLPNNRYLLTVIVY